MTKFSPVTGYVMTLRARWVGPSPRIGDYLMAESRPRYAYCVECVTTSSSDRCLSRGAVGRPVTREDPCVEVGSSLAQRFSFEKVRVTAKVCRDRGSRHDGSAEQEFSA